VILIKQVEDAQASNFLLHLLKNPIHIEEFTPLRRDDSMSGNSVLASVFEAFSGS
jgi:hypothetical protein